jgi:Uma2 family endonuclease
VYLNNKFEGYDVDCEYNGYADGDSNRKYIILLRQKAEELKKLRETDGSDEIIKRNVYPDIIVHERGRNEENSNLVIIEIKKSTSQEKSDFDIEKIKRYTSPKYENHLNYQLGAFILFQTGSDDISCQIDWYVNGENKETWHIEN